MLLGVSGSVAAIKVPLIAELLAQFADVQIVTTDAARRLIPAEFLASTPTPVRGEIGSMSAGFLPVSFPTHNLVESLESILSVLGNSDMRCSSCGVPVSEVSWRCVLSAWLLQQT